MLPLVAPTVETERDDVRDDLRREGLELREEGCSQALAVCLLVGLKATCVKSSNASIPGRWRALCNFDFYAESHQGSRQFSLGKDLRGTRAR